MRMELRERTAETVRIYFEKANTPIIRATLPQKAKTVEEALEDYEKTKLPDATSYGKTIWMDNEYIGDIWCYCIDLAEDPNAMLSYCIFAPEMWGKGIATEAVALFTEDVIAKYHITSMGAFTYADNAASIKVLQNNNFELIDEFMEDGKKSVYFQKRFS